MPPEVELQQEAPAVIEQPPVVEAEQESTEAEGKPEAEETPEQQEVKKQSRNQRKLERARTRAVTAETEARMLREQLAEANKRSAAPQTEKAPPKREDYPDYESYLDARTDYRADLKADERDKAAREAQQGKEKESQAKTTQQGINESWSRREAVFQKTTGDYEEVVVPFLDDEIKNFAQGARQLIIESDVGPAVLYHLASDSDLADRIAAMSPLKQIAEIGRLEAKFEKSEEAEAPVKKTSSAPPPISPAKTAKAGGKDISKMSVAELDAYAKTQGSRWGGSLKRP